MPIVDLNDVLDLFERGETAEAVPMLEHLARRLPTNVTTFVLLARALEAEREFQRALEAWQWAAFLMPNSPLVERGRRRVVRTLTTRTPAPKATAPETHAPEAAAAPEAPAVDADAVPPDAGDADFVDLAGTIDADDDPAAPPTDAPSPAAATPQDLEEYGDLDRLIEELEAARIVPEPDVDDLPAPELDDDIDDMVSETLARIYTTQGQHQEAARIYRLLARQQPDRADEFRAKAQEALARDR